MVDLPVDERVTTGNNQRHKSRAFQPGFFLECLLFDRDQLFEEVSRLKKVSEAHCLTRAYRLSRCGLRAGP